MILSGFNERRAAANGYYNDNRRRWENPLAAGKNKRRQGE